MLIGVGEPVPEPPVGSWDWVGGLVVLGSLVILAIAYLIHAGRAAPRGR